MSQKDQKINIAIGVPTMGIIDYRFASALLALKVPDQTRIIWLPRVMIDTSRNMIVEKTLEDPANTHLLFIDDDMLFPPDLAQHLLSHDEDIVGGLAFKRREMFEPCVYKKKDGKYFPILVNKYTEVDAIGTGILLIKAKVFKKLKYPWFETTYDADGTHWSVDFDFCKKAKKAGFKIYCDPTSDILHIGDPPTRGKQDFLKTLKDKNIQLDKLENHVKNDRSNAKHK